MYFKIKKGLNVPLAGVPKQEISPSSEVERAAVLGVDYRGLKPVIEVKVGDEVRVGDTLFRDRRFPNVCFTSPMGGVVEAINRGEKRVLESVVVKKSHEQYKEFSVGTVSSMTTDDLRNILFESGMWTALRERPYGMMADPEKKPTSIFVTAMDSNPLAMSADVIINQHPEEFQLGLEVLGRLTEGRVHVCQAPHVKIPHGDSPKVIHHIFDGRHPSGNVGTHIHFIDPVNASRCVWHMGYQDTIALGHLFKTGRSFVTRYASFAGYQVKKPRIIKTRLGAHLEQVCKNELHDGENRIISGSPIFGRMAQGSLSFLGRFSNAVCVLKEDRERHFHGFLALGLNKFSLKPTFVSSLLSSKKAFSLGTNNNGSHRDIVPIGSYEEVMPLDIIPTFLIRALLSGDLDRMEKLGVLELDSEDLALCTFVCPGKNEISDLLGDALMRLQKELV